MTRPSKGRRERVLSQDELVAVMPLLVYPSPAGLRSSLDPRKDYGPIAFRFLLLTLSRREEVAEARRKDFDPCRHVDEDGKDTAQAGSHGPAERRTVMLPLSDAAIELLFSLPSFVEGGPEDFYSPRRAADLCATGTERRTPSIAPVEHPGGTVTIFGGLRRLSWASWV